MRTETISIYSFEELSETAKQKAIEDFRNESEIHLDFFVVDCIEVANENGFRNAEFQYSLSYCQGDGLSFSADIDIDYMIEQFNPNLKQSVKDSLYNNIEAVCSGNKGRYCFASKSDISVSFNNYQREYENLTQLTRKLEEFIEDKYLELCREFEEIGYSEIEHQRSSEHIIETISINEYEFTEDGTVY